MKYNLDNEFERNQAKVRLKKLFDERKRVDITEVSPKRTLSQNAYLHVCITLFAIEFGWTREEAKTQLKKLCPFMRYEKINSKSGNKAVFMKQTSMLDKKEMTDFIEWIREFCGKQGCYIPTAEEYKTNSDSIDNIIESNKPHL